MLKLACVNCGAQLEISENLDTFVCGFCGSQQILHRSGGVVALRKVETAIQKLQRGTDRTASELSLARWSQELVEREAEYKTALDGATKPREFINTVRVFMTIVAFFGVVYLGMFIIDLTDNAYDGYISIFDDIGNEHDSFIGLIAFLAALAAAILVYRSIKIPSLQTPEVIAALEKLERIKKNIAVTRASLDEQ